MWHDVVDWSRGTALAVAFLTEVGCAHLIRVNKRTARMWREAEVNRITALRSLYKSVRSELLTVIDDSHRFRIGPGNFQRLIDLIGQVEETACRSAWDNDVSRETGERPVPDGS
jgi:hypothetical protein